MRLNEQTYSNDVKRQTMWPMALARKKTKSELFFSHEKEFFVYLPAYAQISWSKHLIFVPLVVCTIRPSFVLS